MMAARPPPSSPARLADGAQKINSDEWDGASSPAGKETGPPRCHAWRQGDVGATVPGRWEGTAGSGRSSPACCCSCSRGGCWSRRMGSGAGTASLPPHCASSPLPRCAGSGRRGLRAPGCGGNPGVNAHTHTPLQTFRGSAAWFWQRVRLQGPPWVHPPSPWEREQHSHGRCHPCDESWPFSAHTPTPTPISARSSGHPGTPPCHPQHPGSCPAARGVNQQCPGQVPG